MALAGAKIGALGVNPQLFLKFLLFVPTIWCWMADNPQLMNCWVSAKQGSNWQLLAQLWPGASFAVGELQRQADLFLS
jgi:hypothetical protein